ncbi:hypothetical protein SSCG_01291 [Streptomyces clavuligerus]|nr:hypothetical protein SSCG_01291 [Streptomyces clavuligerus]
MSPPRPRADGGTGEPGSGGNRPRSDRPLPRTILEGHAHAERRGDRRELALGGPRRTADRARRFERETAEPLTHRPRRVVAPAARPVWRAAPPLR